MDLFRYGFIHLQTARVDKDSVSRQSSIDLFRYGWIHLHILSAIAKEDSVRCQSGIDLFRYGWIHLLSTILKEDSVSRNQV